MKRQKNAKIKVKYKWQMKWEGEGDIVMVTGLRRQSFFSFPLSQAIAANKKPFQLAPLPRCTSEVAAASLPPFA